MRNRFDEQLAQLNRELTEMGSMCEIAIHSATQALFESHRPHEAIEKTAEIYEEISRKERDIENLCMKLLLQQQPVARDLRTISSALKMISDMERIGDQATDIAEIARFIRGRHQQTNETLRTMAEEAISMVQEAVRSFVERDLALARKVIDDDDVVDRLFDETKTRLITFIAQDGANGEYYLDLLMIAKYLERIGDHATNIAEWVLFSITGRHEN